MNNHSSLELRDKRMQNRHRRPPTDQPTAKFNNYSLRQALPSYKTYFINHATLKSTMEYLLEHVTHSNLLTIAINHDCVTGSPALIQVECVGDPSVLILVECSHLPDPHSNLFHQISCLFLAIFDSTKEIQGWGDIFTELIKFVRFNLFTTLHLQRVYFSDIRYLFREWYNGIFPHSEGCCPSDVPSLNEDSISLHPTDFDLNLSSLHEQYDYLSCSCPHRPYKNPNDHWSLPMAVNVVLQEFLDETFVLSPWNIGLDLALSTYIPNNLVGQPRYMEIKKQKQYRSQLIDWAVLNCLFITKLSVAIRQQWSKPELERYLQLGHIDDDQCDVLNKEISIITQQVSVNDAALSDRCHTTSHYTFDDLEPISDDDIMDVIHSATPVSVVPSSIDTTLKLPQRRIVIVKNKKKRSQAAIHRRCQKRNAIRRIHRHDFNIIRTIYHHFTIQQIEQVLNHLNIRRRHCYIHRHYQLHIGCHSHEDQIRYDDIIDDQYFTKSHYDRVFGYISSSSSSSFHYDHISPDT